MSNPSRPSSSPSVAPPKRGDEVYVPSCHEDGHWTNGIVNAVADRRLLIAAPGHAKSNLVSVTLESYGKHWCWPNDVGRASVGAKSARLSDVEG